MFSEYYENADELSMKQDSLYRTTETLHNMHSSVSALNQTLREVPISSSKYIENDLTNRNYLYKLSNVSSAYLENYLDEKYNLGDKTMAENRCDNNDNFIKSIDKILIESGKREESIKGVNSIKNYKKINNNIKKSIEGITETNLNFVTSKNVYNSTNGDNNINSDNYLNYKSTLINNNSNYFPCYSSEIYDRDVIDLKHKRKQIRMVVANFALGSQKYGTNSGMMLSSLTCQNKEDKNVKVASSMDMIEPKSDTFLYSSLINNLKEINQQIQGISKITIPPAEYIKKESYYNSDVLTSIPHFNDKDTKRVGSLYSENLNNIKVIGKADSDYKSSETNFPVKSSLTIGDLNQNYKNVDNNSNNDKVNMFNNKSSRIKKAFYISDESPLFYQNNYLSPKKINNNENENNNFFDKEIQIMEIEASPILNTKKKQVPIDYKEKMNKNFFQHDTNIQKNPNCENYLNKNKNDIANKVAEMQKNMLSQITKNVNEKTFINKKTSKKSNIIDNKIDRISVKNNDNEKLICKNLADGDIIENVKQTNYCHSFKNDNNEIINKNQKSNYNFPILSTQEEKEDDHTELKAIIGDPYFLEQQNFKMKSPNISSHQKDASEKENKIVYNIDQQQENEVKQIHSQKENLNKVSYNDSKIVWKAPDVYKDKIDRVTEIDINNPYEQMQKKNLEEIAIEIKPQHRSLSSSKNLKKKLNEINNKNNLYIDVKKNDSILHYNKSPNTLKKAGEYVDDLFNGFIISKADKDLDNKLFNGYEKTNKSSPGTEESKEILRCFIRNESLPSAEDKNIIYSHPIDFLEIGKPNVQNNEVQIGLSQKDILKPKNETEIDNKTYNGLSAKELKNINVDEAFNSKTSKGHTYSFSATSSLKSTKEKLLSKINKVAHTTTSTSENKQSPKRSGQVEYTYILNPKTKQTYF